MNKYLLFLVITSSFILVLKSMEQEACSGVKQNDHDEFVNSWDSSFSGCSRASSVKEDNDTASFEVSYDDDSYAFPAIIPSYQYYEEDQRVPENVSLKYEVDPRIRKYIPGPIYKEIKNAHHLGDDEKRLLLISVAQKVKEDRENKRMISAELEKHLPGKSMLGKKRVIILSNLIAVVLGFLTGAVVTIGTGWGLCA